MLPKLEAKSVIYKTFANVDAVPIALKTQDPYEIIEIVRVLAPSFGGFCLESIAAPKCFTIENRIRHAVRVSVLHHENHASGIIVLAALYNALKVVGKSLKDVRVVINGAGAAGTGVAKGLVVAGNNNMVICDRHGALRVYRTVGMDWAKSEIARLVGPQDVKGSLAEVIKGADVFIGLSAGGLVSREMVASMAKDPIVFALALPEPEISEAEARAGGAAVVATGQADSENQIRSSLVTPGFFRGCLDVGAHRVNIEMYLAAARALADMIPEDQLSPQNIIPRQMDWHISPVIAEAVARAAQETGVAQMTAEVVTPERIHERTESYIYEGELAWLPSEGQDYGSLSIDEEALELHSRYQGCIQVYAKVPIKDEVIYRRLYAPEAVAEVCTKILQDPMGAYDYTCKNNLVAIVTDGSAVLGLGNIGPRAALPVMEGKAILFKTFGGVEAFPICISTQEPDRIVEVVENISPVFAGINLEDISSPRCFDIEQRLCERLDIPVFHDDQHGTAVVGLAALLNALKITDRKIGRGQDRLQRGRGLGHFRDQAVDPGRRQKHHGVRHHRHRLPGPRQGHEPHQGRAGGHHQPGPAAGLPGRCLAGRRGLLRAFRAQRPHPGHGEIHGRQPHRLRPGQPGPGNPPRGRPGGRGPGGGHGAVGFPQPGEQLPGVPRHLPGGLGHPGPAHQRCHEHCRGPRHRRPGGRQIEPGLYPAGSHGFPGAPGGGRGRGPGRHGNRHRQNPDRTGTGGPPYPGIHLRRAAVDSVIILEADRKGWLKLAELSCRKDW